MRRIARVTRALFTVTFAEFAEYRAEIVIWIFAGLLPLIMMFIWMAITETQPVAGYRPADFAVYFLLVFFVRQMTMIWVMYLLDYEIRLGDLSPKLLRPLDPVWGYVVGHLTSQAMRLPIVGGVALLGLWLAGTLGALSPSDLPAFLLAIAGAWLIQFNMKYGLGLLTFWTDQAIALDNLTYTLYVVLGGALFPLDLLPEAVRQALVYTPFPYVISFPVEAMTGKLDGGELLHGFAMQALWIVLFFAMQRWLWRRGLRRFGAVGA